MDQDQFDPGLFLHDNVVFRAIISPIPPLAQLVEHPTLNRLVVGSNPTGRTELKSTQVMGRNILLCLHSSQALAVRKSTGRQREGFSLVFMNRCCDI